MDDDIVMRLRVATVADTTKSLYAIMTEAADEIERLRLHRDHWKQTAKKLLSYLSIDLVKQKVTSDE